MSASLPIDETKLIADLRDPSRASDAFGILMRQYGEKVYWQIRKTVFNHDDAVDILQNVFLKAWASLNSFRGEARLSTWLYKIAVNESINFLKRERTRQAHTADDENDSFLLDNLEADPWFDGTQLQADLLRFVATLPEKQRLVFNMRYFDEMKYEEISDILGTSVGSLKASYHHAVKKIIQHFKL